MTIFLTKNLDFKTKNSSLKPFLFTPYFASHQIKVLLKILVGRMHGPSPHLKYFWGTVPPVPLSLHQWI